MDWPNVPSLIIWVFQYRIANYYHNKIAKNLALGLDFIYKKNIFESISNYSAFAANNASISVW